MCPSVVLYFVVVFKEVLDLELADVETVAHNGLLENLVVVLTLSRERTNQVPSSGPWAGACRCLGSAAACSCTAG